MSAFTWLSQVMEFLGSFIPKLLIIKSTWAGVKYVRGHKPILLPPGLHFIWPIVTSVETYPTARQTLELSNQTLTTRDGATVSIAVIVVYTVEDMFTLLTTVYDAEETVTDVAKGSVIEVLNGLTYDDLIGVDLGHEIGKKCRAMLKNYGVAVERALVTDFTKTFAIHISK